MLTGDPSAQAFEVARELGIDTVYKGLTPNDKVQHLKALQQQGVSRISHRVGSGRLSG